MNRTKVKKSIDKKMIRELLTSGQIVSKLTSLRGAREPIVLLFSATRKEDGSRWCPDCEASDEILNEAVQHAPAGVYYLVVELTREEWKVNPGQEHFLRKEPYKVAGIPTMMLWDSANEKSLKRFGEADLLQLESVSDFFRTLGDE